MPFIDTLKTYVLVLFELIKTHGVTLLIVTVTSFIGSILFCTLVIAYLPSDYFLPKKRTILIKQPVLRIGFKCLKNLLGVVLVIVGFIQIPLPGPGILTVLIGVIISDIPGKRRLERRIIRSPVVLAAANGIRSRFKRPLLMLDKSTE
ncbi:MAG: hypothetical protein OYL97_12705 [Candidatus Poribacteria bacterium]|nr:hypothetical protein [Candidatus Poribacteria bacterium]